MGQIISGIGTMIGGNEAARKSEAASSNLNQRYDVTSGNLMPYITAGQNVLDPLTALATSGPTGGGPNYVTQAAANVPLQMSQAQLEQTPGYQFTLGQGMKALQSSAAARGLGVSGASMKAGAAYTTGLANTTYKNQFDMAQSRFNDYLLLNTGQQGQITNQAARLQSIANLGGQTGAELGSIGANLGSSQANALMSAGNDIAYGTQGLATGIGNAVNTALGIPIQQGPSATGAPQASTSLQQMGMNWLAGPSSTPNPYGGYNVTGLPSTGFTPAPV